jgi:hypothetical protein
MRTFCGCERARIRLPFARSHSPRVRQFTIHRSASSRQEVGVGRELSDHESRMESAVPAPVHRVVLAVAASGLAGVAQPSSTD